MIAHILRARQAFAGVAALDEDVLPLDRAALTIALEEYPDMEIEYYLRQLDVLAMHVETILGVNREPANVFEALNEILYGREGLRGNEEDYYDPRNSFLNQVLDRKLGIPISLSVIYIEVARRLGFPLEGVGFPGHFIVKYSRGEQKIFLDPYNSGQILGTEDCQKLLDRIYSGSVVVLPSFLRGMDKKGIISRMLYNLKGIYYQKEDLHRALSVVERILLLNPGTPSEIRDRGLLFMQTPLFSKALADLEVYLSGNCMPDEEASLRSHVKTLRAIVTCSN